MSAHDRDLMPVSGSDVADFVGNSMPVIGRVARGQHMTDDVASECAHDMPGCRSTSKLYAVIRLMVIIHGTWQRCGCERKKERKNKKLESDKDECLARRRDHAAGFIKGRGVIPLADISLNFDRRRRRIQSFSRCGDGPGVPRARSRLVAPVRFFACGVQQGIQAVTSP